MRGTIDIDTGGTFTDGFFVRDGEVRTVKVPTTPHDLTQCFLDCIEAGANAYDMSAGDLLYDTQIVRFSSTIGTNTIIQRDGTKVGLLFTAGREDLALTAGDGERRPLVEPGMVVGIAEEVSDSGETVREPGEKEILKAAQGLIDKGARCLVIAFQNSELNAGNERAARRIIKNEYPRDYLGSVPVFLASDLTPRPGDEERVNTAVVNAYIHARLTRLLYKAGEDLRQRHYQGTLFIGHNNGTAARVAKTRAIHTYNSGPAAGLLGARWIGSLYGADDLISTDMGGTSFDIGYVRRGQASYALRPDVEGFACNLPMISIRALGAGGGSIAAVVDGALQVGPQSAGALPGPVCFDLGGTEPTVTDANLVLGILDPSFFLGGAMTLATEKARQAIDEKIAQPLGLGVEAAARLIRETVAKDMGREVAKVADLIDGEALPLVVAYGGAGGLHATDIADAAGLGRVVMTPFAPVSSAFSSSLADVGHLYYRRLDIDLANGADVQPLQDALAQMQQEAARDMRGEGFEHDPEKAVLQLFIEGAGGEEVIVPAVPDQVNGGNLAALAGHVREVLGADASKAKNLMLGTLGYLATAAVPHYEAEPAPAAKQKVDQALKAEREVLSGGGEAVAIPVYDWPRLENGHAIAGPAIVESDQTTILVTEGWGLTIDTHGNAMLERGNGDED